MTCARKTCVIVIALCLSGASAAADSVVPSRTIRANSIISAQDVRLEIGEVSGGFEHMSDVVGQEARTNLYAGRPIRPGDIGAPAIVERNQIITLVFSRGGLNIETDGRALDRGGVGDRLRAMNLTSRSTVFGVIDERGAIHVGK